MTYQFPLSDGLRLNGLGEDHCFLFLGCQCDEGLKYCYISVADLMDRLVEYQRTWGHGNQVLTVATEASVVLTPLPKKLPTAPEPVTPSVYFLSWSTCSEMAFWNAGHISNLMVNSTVSSGAQPRRWVSYTISSVSRIIVSRGMIGGVGSMHDLTKD